MQPCSYFEQILLLLFLGSYYTFISQSRENSSYNCTLWTRQFSLKWRAWTTLGFWCQGVLFIYCTLSCPLNSYENSLYMRLCHALPQVYLIICLIFLAFNIIINIILKVKSPCIYFTYIHYMLSNITEADEMLLLTVNLKVLFISIRIMWDLQTLDSISKDITQWRNTHSLSNTLYKILFSS